MALPAPLSPIRRPRLWGVWFGLLLLLIADLLASGLPQPRAAVADSPLFVQKATGDRIVICSPGGLVVIDRATGLPVTADADAPKRDFCVVCLPCMQGGFALPPSTDPAQPVVQRIIPQRPRAVTIALPHRPAGDAWPRGPPAPRSM